jgi:hypothetical protein
LISSANENINTQAWHLALADTGASLLTTKHRLGQLPCKLTACLTLLLLLYYC